MKNTPTSMADNELISLTDKEENGISNLEIIALVGNPSTGKSTSLIRLITVLLGDNNWKLSGNVISQIDFYKIDPNLDGDPKDQVAIFNNKKTGKKVGIVTPGDSVSIVSAGLKYLALKNVDIAVVAAHSRCFDLFITKINSLTIGIKSIKSSLFPATSTKYTEAIKKLID